MKTNKKYYYKVYLQLSLRGEDYVFGFINLSHIPYSKFEELFRDQVKYEKFLFDDSMSYFIEANLYNKYKEYLDKEVPIRFDFSIFEYSVGLSSVEIQKYKKDYYEELPNLARV